MWFLVIVLTLALIIVSIFLGQRAKFSRNEEDKNKKLQQELNKKNKEVQSLQVDNVRLNGLIDTLKSNDVSAMTFENRIVEYNQRIEEKQNTIRDLEDQLSDIQGELWRIALANRTLREKYDTTVNEYDDKRTKVFELSTIEAELKDEWKKIERDIDVARNELKDLSERKRLAILNQDEIEDGLWDLDINDRDIELIKLLKRIESDYPELKVDIAMIEWRKIWLPKLQDLGNREGLKKSGIYRLVLKSDHTICYVGQAVNIQERWYQHVKKMIGVEAKGGEKLYGYRPEDFLWSVMEDVKGNLDESERYWIEYWGCKEKGLNKK